MMLFAKNYNDAFEFVKVMYKIGLLLVLFSGHSVDIYILS